jgi:hypothetical protein
MALPTFAARIQGDAWANPFVFVYESSTGDEGFAVKSVERLMDKRGFKGLKINVDTGTKQLTQYVILNNKLESNYNNDEIGISFKGRFAIISVDEKTQASELYIGQGQELKYKSKRITASAKENGSMAEFKAF